MSQSEEEARYAELGNALEIGRVAAHHLCKSLLMMRSCGAEKSVTVDGETFIVTVKKLTKVDYGKLFHGK